MEKTGYRAALLETFRYLQAYGRVEDNPAYWEAVTRTGSDISKKYQNTPLAPLVNALLIAVHDELQRRYAVQFPRNADKTGGCKQ